MLGHRSGCHIWSPPPLHTHLYELQPGVEGSACVQFRTQLKRSGFQPLGGSGGRVAGSGGVRAVGRDLARWSVCLAESSARQAIHSC